jgi:hypothetical protein
MIDFISAALSNLPLGEEQGKNKKTVARAKSILRLAADLVRVARKHGNEGSYASGLSKCAKRLLDDESSPVGVKNAAKSLRDLLSGDAQKGKKRKSNAKENTGTPASKKTKVTPTTTAAISGKTKPEKQAVDKKETSKKGADEKKIEASEADTKRNRKRKVAADDVNGSGDDARTTALPQAAPKAEKQKKIVKKSK